MKPPAGSMVSIVLPVYNERENLAPLLTEIRAALSSIPHEIVAVDDGSTDGSLAELERLHRDYPLLRVVALARNAGQSAAFAAGFDFAHGDLLVTMDADGQNDPADIPSLLTVLYDDPTCAAAVGYRRRRADSGWKQLQSRVANAARDRITGHKVRDTGCSLKAMRRAAVEHLPRFDGMHRFFPTLIRLTGGKVTEVAVTHRPRRWGRSKYGAWNRGARGLRDALGVRWLSRRTLRYSIRKDVT